MRNQLLCGLALSSSTILPSALAGADVGLRQQAADTMRRSVNFYRTEISSHGGYVYRYSADLSKREGEGKTGLDTVWVQPPGTPFVGMAYLDAHRRTGHEYLLEAARAAGDCLVRGQLRSGGWTSSIEFSPQARTRHAYRVDPLRRKARNWTTFDDDKTQSAMRMLMQLDKALDFQDTRVHEAIEFALDAVLKAQFPNGAWPQGFREFPDPENYPVRAASYPESWPRTYPGGDYWLYYTFNDNAIADTIETLFLAADVYDNAEYAAAAVRGAEFILLAQMPEPQPAWAQQYDFQMHPVWAREFEPPAISGGESQGIIEALLRVYVRTGDRRFLAPVPKAIEYLRRSRLESGQLARFYELRTNRPLYFNRAYELTYADDDLPTHYSFQVTSRLPRSLAQYEELSRLDVQQLSEMRRKMVVGRSQEDRRVPETRVRDVIAAIDDRGAWVESGRLRYHGKGDTTRRVIESSTFARNLDILSRYLQPQAE